MHLAGLVEILGIWANFAPSLNLDSSAILVYSALVQSWARACPVGSMRRFPGAWHVAPARRIRALGSAPEFLSEEQHQQGMSVQHIFDDLDRDGNGTMSYDELDFLAPYMGEHRWSAARKRSLTTSPHETPRMPTTVPSAGGDGAAQVPALQQPDGAHPGRADGAHPGRARQPHIPQSAVRHPGTSRYTMPTTVPSVGGGSGTGTCMRTA